MTAFQPLLREELDIERARLYAESCRRVFGPCCDEARANVSAGRRTRAQAFADARRRYESLRKEYFGRRSPWGTPQATERDWAESGPERAYRDLYAEFFA